MSAVIVAHGLCKDYLHAGSGPRSLKELVVRGLTGRAAPPRARTAALRDVSFHVDDGESVGIIGSNGSGKSTLLRMIAGIARPTHGNLAVHGRVSALLELGVAFQQDFTGRENVYLYGALLGLSRRALAERFDAIVDFAELREAIDAPVRTYSSGMAVRLAFATAVHIDPDIILLDEVLAVGDEAFQRKCRQRMDAFRAAGHTIVLVSHQLDAVQRLCSRVLWLDGGVLRAHGAPADVIGEYQQSVAPA